MNMDIYNKAITLVKDIESLKRHIDEVEFKKHWISIVTPDNRDLPHSLRLQAELVEWMKAKKEEYEKEFNELN